MTPNEAFNKAWESGKRLPELEHIIMTDPWCSYLYSEYVIKGRWVEAEDIIMTDPRYCYLYAVDTIKGQLPEKMHNMMILNAIEEPNSYAIKQYFEYIK